MQSRREVRSGSFRPSAGPKYRALVDFIARSSISQKPRDCVARSREALADSRASSRGGNSRGELDCFGFAYLTTETKRSAVPMLSAQAATF